MNTKLTLTIEQSVIAQAKKYARAKEKSLSGLIENYLKALTSEESVPDEKLTPTVKTLKGSFKLPPDFDYKKALTDRLTEKYLS